jgi:nucleoside-diphosphate-sugar epimerase
MNQLTIIGLGDVARRTLTLLNDWHVTATTRAILDLDEASKDTTLFHALPTANAVLYTAPPPNTGETDTRLTALLSFWQTDAERRPTHLVYISTTGVYGDCGGAWVDESTPPNPQSARAVRRVDAEQQLTNFAKQYSMTLTILRAPGIYALERLPLARVLAGTPILKAEEDSFSNHIHADDLAAVCVVALRQPKGISTYNVCDDEPLSMGDWFTLLSKAADWPAPPRVTREEITQKVSAQLLSFMRESRRIRNDVLKRDLDIALKYPSARQFVTDHRTAIALLAAEMQKTSL